VPSAAWQGGCATLLWGVLRGALKIQAVLNSQLYETNEAFDELGVTDVGTASNLRCSALELCGCLACTATQTVLHTRVVRLYPLPDTVISGQLAPAPL
jgi:hypothetical protein